MRPTTVKRNARIDYQSATSSAMKSGNIREQFSKIYNVARDPKTHERIGDIGEKVDRYGQKIENVVDKLADPILSIVPDKYKSVAETGVNIGRKVLDFARKVGRFLAKKLRKNNAKSGRMGLASGIYDSVRDASADADDARPTKSRNQRHNVMSETFKQEISSSGIRRPQQTSNPSANAYGTRVPSVATMIEMLRSSGYVVTKNESKIDPDIENDVELDVDETNYAQKSVKRPTIAKQSNPRSKAQNTRERMLSSIIV